MAASIADRLISESPFRFKPSGPRAVCAMPHTDGEAVADATAESEPPVAPTEESDFDAAVAALRIRKDLPRPPYPTPPILAVSTASVESKVVAVQAYIEKLGYNFTEVNYFDARHTHRPIAA